MLRTVAAALVVSLGGPAWADEKKAEPAAKLVGKWEITTAGGSAPAGTTLTFFKDGKAEMLLTMDGARIRVAGSYRFNEGKLHLKWKYGDQDSEETLSVRKLSDDALELEDKDKGVDVLKKLKS